MKPISLSFFLAFYLFNFSAPNFNGTIRTDALGTKKSDTTNSFKIEGYRVTPKASFEFSTLNKSGIDTLDMVACSDYIYSPFGKVNDKRKFASSLLKNFTVVNRIQATSSGKVEVQILKHKASKLVFFFDNSDTATHSDILKGEIYDDDVVFFNAIRIGIKEDDFYKIFFDYFPPELRNKYKVIAMESCVDGIKHVYSFKDGKLSSVKFISDYQFDVDY